MVRQNRTLEHAHLLNHEDSVPGLEINEKIQSQFCDKIQKFSHNLGNFSRKIAALRCVVSDLAKKYEPAILVCKEIAENGE